MGHWSVLLHWGFCLRFREHLKQNYLLVKKHRPRKHVKETFDAENVVKELPRVVEEAIHSSDEAKHSDEMVAGGLSLHVDTITRKPMVVWSSRLPLPPPPFPQTPTMVVEGIHIEWEGGANGMENYLRLLLQTWGNWGNTGARQLCSAPLPFFTKGSFSSAVARYMRRRKRILNIFRRQQIGAAARARLMSPLFSPGPPPPSPPPRRHRRLKLLFSRSLPNLPGGKHGQRRGSRRD
jgi:hypothetical protein